MHVRRLARGWLAERGGRVGGWRVPEAKLEAAVSRAGAKLLQHYGSIARFVDGGGVDGAGGVPSAGGSGGFDPAAK